ncbi:hypothetical protein NMSP_0846 [Candidatus Nitrosomarinus catalina]|jgi:hypothetical protein|uniref:Uncharacterized protein n=1 Tax=Candidatus Nitrosomarinus catalinensis TaxID=1898749 RepID=A0A2Z2HL67_9ARCH|nr:hypothetical protein [Candidatus Nitrosomarinus catalina]ARS64465.1 hypothetical protein NMSP_0846 [Candidatus Nitrosomarinus catalina]
MSTYAELLQEYREKFDREIFPLLVSNQLIHKNTGRVYHSFQKRLDRIELQKNSIENKISLLKQHMSDGNKVEDFDKSQMFDLITMFAQSIMSYFEIYKSCLKFSLNFEKLEITKSQPGYNEMIDHLGDFKNNGVSVFHKAGLRTFFNVDLRNVLTNDSWWINNNFEFTYEEPDGTELSLSIGELYGELASINSIVLGFTENHQKNFDDESS